MNKESFNELFIRKESEIIEYHYSISHGKKELYSYSKKIKYVDDEHFTTSGYGYDIKYNDIQKWHMQSWSSNSYSYRIFLLKGEPIDNYISEINKRIIEGLNKEIEELQKSIEIIKNPIEECI